MGGIRVCRRASCDGVLSVSWDENLNTVAFYHLAGAKSCTFFLQSLPRPFNLNNIASPNGGSMNAHASQLRQWVRRRTFTLFPPFPQKNKAIVGPKKALGLTAMCLSVCVFPSPHENIPHPPPPPPSSRPITVTVIVIISERSCRIVYRHLPIPLPIHLLSSL